MKQRRESTKLAIEKRKKKNKQRRDDIGGLSPSQFNKQNSNTGGGGDKKKTTKTSGPYVTKNGKRYLKTSTMGKKIVKEQKRNSLASKNYMSKEMIEKRKKRLKIKK
jgi:hypothetical protein